MRVDIIGAAKHTGLSEYAIRKAIRMKRLPCWQTGGGKYIFDTELLDEAINKEMLSRLGGMNERN